MRICLELADVGLALGRIRTDRSDCLKIAGIDSVGEINRRPSRRYGLLPLRDLLSFAVFVVSLFGETVHWRGTYFAVEPSGAMSQV